MARLGKADATVDVTYSQEKDRFLEHYKNVKKINEDARKMMDIVKCACMCECRMLLTREQLSSKPKLPSLRISTPCLTLKLSCTMPL